MSRAAGAGRDTMAPEMGMTARISLTVAVAVMAATTLACAGPGEGEPEVTVANPVTTVPVTAAPERPPAAVQWITPVLAVEAIEPAMPFWQALGFEPINPNRVDGRLVYVAFARSGLEVQYQTFAQLERIMPGQTDTLRGGRSLVYLAVDDLDAVIERLGGAEIVIPRRQTEWGSDEIFVREPGGHVIGFAAFQR